MTSLSLVEQVRGLYERHPYPRYPLLARPRWSPGYTSSMTWTQFQYALHCEENHSPQILIAGSGEILPWVIEKWAPPNAILCALDLSYSSLQRALLRRWMTRPWSSLGRKYLRWIRNGQLSSWVPPGKTDGPQQDFRGLGCYFCQGDLLHFLEKSPSQSWNHIDAYGVIHHMASPRMALEQMSRVLSSGGILRLMVYNTPARRWIRNIQRLFMLLGLDFAKDADFRFAGQLLAAAAAHSPRLRQRLSQMGPSILKNRTRFADTFFHPREIQASPVQWHRWIESAGFKILGQFDRYGELDHLPNPLWQPPSAEVLQQEVKNGLFEGNLEYYLVKKGKQDQRDQHRIPFNHRSENAPPLTISKKIFFELLLQGPPPHWFQFPETASITMPKRYHLWFDFLKRLYGRSTPTQAAVKDLPPSACQRLARLGYFARPQAGDPLSTALKAPLSPSPPKNGELPVSDHRDGRNLLSLIENHLGPLQARHPSKRFLNVVSARVKRLLES